MTINVSASEAVRRLEFKVTVTGIKTMRVRMWLGVRLIRLAAMVIGCGIKVEESA